MGMLPPTVRGKSKSAPPPRPAQKPKTKVPRIDQAQARPSKGRAVKKGKR
jgi:hypothetical protein